MWAKPIALESAERKVIMANTTITIAGSVVVLRSAHSLEELEKTAAYMPEALMLKDDNGNVYFTLTPGVVGIAKHNNLTYSETAPDGSGKACLTLPRPAGDDAKKAVAAMYGPIIANANKVEEQVSAALAEVNAMLAAVEDQITVAGETELPDTETENG